MIARESSDVATSLGLARLSTLVASVTLCVSLLSVATARSASLPEGRAYEQVSPEFKAGYPVASRSGFSAFALDGESAKFVSIGAFSGSGEDFALNPYLGRRTTSGWVTSPLFPPATGGEFWNAPEEFSPNLSSFEYLVSPGSTAIEDLLSPTNAVWVRQTNGSSTQASLPMTTEGGVESSSSVLGASLNLSHFLLAHSDTPPQHFFPGDETAEGVQLFEADSSSVRLVDVDNGGAQLTKNCNVRLGGPLGGQAFDAVSQPNAAEVFFSVCDKELYVRVDGTKTIKLASNGVFQGASEGGERVFFTTSESLVAEDKDSANDLYMATIGCSGGGEGEGCGSLPREVTSIVLVSHDPTLGHMAEVGRRVLAVSRDGLHAYFVAKGVLSDGVNVEGEGAAEGADNLYAYDGSTPAGNISFIGKLCSGPEKSGVVADEHCPSSLNEKPNGPSHGAINDLELWESSDTHQVQATSDGHFLVFTTYAQLVSKGPDKDADASADIYRYDATTGSLNRVSIGEAGADGNGNNDAFNANLAQMEFRGSLPEQFELGSRAITENGSIVVFTTAEPLSSHAVNGQPDVYLWREGSVSMISSGTAEEPDVEPVITPSGRDLFFSTSAGLVPGDTDGLRDIYDARIGGGFPIPAASREPCSGDGCQGPLSTPGVVTVPGSASQAPENEMPTAPSKSKPVTKGKPVKHKKVTKRSKKIKAKRGRGTKMSVKVGAVR